MTAQTLRAHHRESAVSPGIRVLIVDDSAVVRAMLERIVGDHPQFTVVGMVDRAQRAIAWLEDDLADIILLDIEMPGRDGLAALPDMLKAGRGARIVIVSSFAGEGAAATVQALALGAADAIAKPEIGAIGRQFAANLLDRLLGLVLDRKVGGDESQDDLVTRAVPMHPVECVAIGASTGGLHALARFFGALPPGFDAPVLVTQHLPSAFIPFFTAQLAAMSGRRCVVAAEGTRIDPATVYVAPGDSHLGCERVHGAGVIRLSQAPVPSRSLPSVDPMFAALATTYGENGAGVVLSGMGRDGLNGAHHIVSAGAPLLAQDEASAVIWGMPGAVARAGMASLIGPPERLAEHLRKRGART